MGYYLEKEWGNYTYIGPLKQKAWFSQMLNDFDSYPGDIITKGALQMLLF
ncbi:MAG: hypothetical protein AB8V06_05305 [Francisella endosymbiont of Hyalomma asiaticum]